MDANPKSKKSFGLIFQTAVLTAMLIILPLGSWYYLQRGFNYNKAMMSQLKDYGTIPAFSFHDQKGRPFTKDDIAGKLVVSAFFTESSIYKDTLMDKFKRIHSRFDEREDVFFVLHALDSLNASQLLNIAEEYKLKDHDQFYLVSGNENEMLKLLYQGYGVPDLVPVTDTVRYAIDRTLRAQKEYPYLIFSDTSSVIRSYYKLDDGPSRARLVEHMAVKLPRIKVEKPVLKREKEK